MSYYYSNPIPTNFNFPFKTSDSSTKDLASQFPTVVNSILKAPPPLSNNSNQSIVITLPLNYSGSLSTSNQTYIQNIIFSSYGISTLNGINTIYSATSLITFLPWTQSFSEKNNLYYTSISNITQLNATGSSSIPNYITIGTLPASTITDNGLSTTSCIFVDTLSSTSAFNLGIIVPPTIPSLTTINYSFMILN
jgi:hypothetical protein